MDVLHDIEIINMESNIYFINRINSFNILVDSHRDKIIYRKYSNKILIIV